MLESIFVTAVFMIFQVFFLTKWLGSHEEKKEILAWTPFRKLLLNGVVEHFDSLMDISTNFQARIDPLLEKIKAEQALTVDGKREIERLLSKTIEDIKLSKDRFFFTVQTVSPCLRAYASDYCSQLFVFGDYFLRNLQKAKIELSKIDEKLISDNNHTSQPLNGVWAYSSIVDMVRDYGFSRFKKNFVDSVWKTEGLHYHETENEFLTRDEYSRALESDKSKIELGAIPRTSPIKSFFDLD